MIGSVKTAIEYFEQWFKLEELNQFRRTIFYLTNRKDKEITLSRGVVMRMKEQGLITGNNDYVKPINNNATS